VIGGARVDRYDVNVRDHLQRPDGSSTTGVAGATAVSPKFSVVLSPAKFLDLFLNYGRGFHSNDARGATRTLDPTGRTVTLLTTADGYEAGVRARPYEGVDLAAAVFRLDLDSETVWVGDEGRTESRGPTKRLGVELEARWKLAKWFFVDADATFTRATFVENAGNANAVALAPTRTFSAGIGFKHPSGTFGSFRVRSIASRPATEDRLLTAEGWTVFDASLGHRFKWFELAADVRNVFNTSYREVQFANESRLKSESEPVRDIHFTPGWPITALLRANAYF
jgi:outer membrane receptor protein involved in Fe transport